MEHGVARQVNAVVRALLAAALLAVPLCAAPAGAGGSGTVRGTVTTAGAGQDGIAIEVYLEEKQGAGGAPFAVTESRDGGRFSLELPAGSYYLWAKGKAPAFGPPRVAEHPANPVVVSAGAATELPPLELREIGGGAVPPAPRETGLRGKVLEEGKASADASVMVYDGRVARLAGPGFVASMLTGPDGLFQFDLAPGSYKVSARKRRDGAAAGYLRSGDLSAEYAGNPVAVAPGRYTDLGDLPLHPVDVKRLAERERTRREGSAPTRLAGGVAGPEGKPLTGQYVFVYRDPGMIGRPTLMTVTGTDGAFSFDLPGGGTWYVGARSTMGGPRQPGEMVGRLAGSADSSVVVKEGTTRTGLAITMEVAW